MKIFINLKLITYIITILFISGCAKNTTPLAPINLDPSLNDIQFGTDETFEIITWNIENFPKQNTTTVQMAKDIILAIDADVYALQEIESSSYFDLLIDELNTADTTSAWIGYVTSCGNFCMELSYIIKSNTVTIINEPFEIYPYEGSAFPREPYIFDLLFNSDSIRIINNHLKCCGGGDNESRRQLASELLQEWVEDNPEYGNVIIVGDWNDEIHEPQSTNVFWNFIENDQQYLFADMELAEDPTENSWSYPSWPSHIDHILITDDLFDEFENPISKIQTILVGDYLPGAFIEYNQKVSDHLPVGLKLKF
ncbi:MAG: hypothetical protein HN729_09845 [Candidatus Marinimicrobia bacterium]|jgi:endonuclease/exonuclease/phosphatase family metal-dependent hydrolase|nr:hypothetical protein [Candidatus Neomarinimicrobiota bacterium]MBT3633130.1 hypothetical protein [Candidatus Neomarinimicrobiota bacterium]MBT3682269.1 hypothetical protein [Candidatus Neomarinimicrobiota bacterium]MBT3758730.1 hypothetical protein [Candidatus Neomarinimicrobiota bacterium]MBT3895396.1 hypothetical protein [Candidatus Neomarinimicrobiota bacterium]